MTSQLKPSDATPQPRQSPVRYDSPRTDRKYPNAVRFLAPAFVCRGLFGALSLALCLLGLVPLSAQTTASSGVIEGRVQNATSGRYLENARVTVVGTGVEAFTDSSGHYRLNVPSGPAKLEVFFTGLARRDYTLEVPAGGRVQQNVVLSRANATSEITGEEVIQLDPFTVAAEREFNAAAIAINEQRFAGNKREVVSTDAFGEISQGNIGEFLKHVPGISFELKDGNNLSGVMVRGFNSNYTNVTFDGAQMASAALSNTQTHTRQFVLEQANINNIARIEVVKLPTPDIQANLLGGAVNFISKTAFEVPSRQVTASFGLAANEKEFDLSKTPGPGRGSSYKLRPNVRFSYLQPVNEKFGFVVTGSVSSQYFLRNEAVIGRRYTSSGATLENPQIPNVNTTAGQNLQTQYSGSLKLDWKPAEGHVLSLAGEATLFTQMAGSRTLNHNVGNGTPASWGPAFTNGSTGASGTGTTNLGHSFQQRWNRARNVRADWKFDRDVWHAEAGAAYSHAAVVDADMSKGFFRSVSTAIPSVRTVNIADVNNENGSFGTATVLNAAGQTVDYTNLANVNLTTAQGEPRSAEDEVIDFRAKVTRDFELPGRIPLKVSAGGSSIKTMREIDYAVVAYTYLGPDGIQNSGDESLATFGDSNFSTYSPGFGRPEVQWPSPWLVYERVGSNPNQWTRTNGQQGDTIRNRAQRSPLVYEQLTAAYLMGDTKLFNRTRIVGGVRYELTENWGWGTKQDSSVLYQKDASGNLIRVNGQLVRRPDAPAAGTPAEVAAIYTYRGQYNERDYDHLFSSIHTTTEIIEGLQLRVAYAETIGRPRIVDVVPNLTITDSTTFDPNVGSGSPGTINSANTSLKPWTGKNFDYALEYYLPNSGSLVFNYFRKDIRDFFGSVTRIADAALLEELGLSDSYLGYNYTTRTNIGDARIEGWEANAVIPLANFKFLGDWARYFTIRGNITHLQLSGSRIGPNDFGNYTPRMRNGGIQFASRKFRANLLANYKGRMLRDNASQFPGAQEFIASRLQIDADITWQFHKNWSAYISGRNINNDPEVWEVTGPGAPDYAAVTSYRDYGAQYQAGVSASF
jgi:iron complex outermembrane receptor protein